MTFHPNPVAIRESRAMWRGARSFLLLGCYTGALSLVAWLAYSSEVRSAFQYANGGEAQVQSARVGRTLFVALSYVQLVAWLLIAPALAATSVASERERGLLESLLMSHLKPRQIIAGKFSVCASFLAILIVATLPVLALCFLLGGVSPGEFGGALAIQVATVFCALSFGLWCSASLRLSTHALGAAFGFMAGWMLLTAMAPSLADSAALGDWRDSALHLIGLLNPLFGLYQLLEPKGSALSSFFLDAPWRWPVCVVAQVLGGAFFLWRATRALSRPLSAEEAEPPARRKGNQGSQSKGANARGDQVEDGQAGASTSGLALGGREGDGHFDVPILRGLVGGGPLLRHHLRSSWRWKKPRGRSLKVWRVSGVAFAVVSLYALSWIMRTPDDAPGLLVLILVAVGLGVPIFATASGALSIARDREMGTWNGLRLSAIGSGEIALAKILTPIASGLGYSILLLGPLFVLAYLVARGDAQANSPERNFEWHFLRAALIVIPMWLLGTLELGAWGLICSIRARRSSIALVAAFAGALIFLAGVPIVLSLSFSYGDYESRRWLEQAMSLIHPIYALNAASDVVSKLSYDLTSRDDVYPMYCAALASHAAIVAGLARLVTHAIAQREK